jgi:hypothetical protein
MLYCLLKAEVEASQKKNILRTQPSRISLSKGRAKGRLR